MSDPAIPTDAIASTSTQASPSDLVEAASLKPGKQSLHSKANRKGNHVPVDYDDLLEKRVSVIQVGDVVMLQTPSDVIKIVHVAKNGIISIGKYGSFPTSQLIGRHFGITYEIVPASTSESNSPVPESGPVLKVKQQNKAKGKGKGKAAMQDLVSGAANVLRPMRPPKLEELEETDATNDLIDDNPLLSIDVQAQMLSAEEILDLRAEGFTAEEIMNKQIERHERFGLKTEYSKEKWKKRKEKKYSSTVLPLAPTVANMIFYYNSRAASQTIMSMRSDTFSQLLTLGNIRPGGRYLVVDDTGGLTIGGMLDRMGGEGRILQLVENDSPPAWAVLEGMNFPKNMVEKVAGYLNWHEAEETYEPAVMEMIHSEERVDLPVEPVNPVKEAQKNRKRDGILAALNRTRDELHRGEWDGLVITSNLSPPSVLSRLVGYLAGSASIVVYGQWIGIMSETLKGMKDRNEYLAPNLTESWTRRYQVLPGRTHPMMSMSGTGGFLLHATKVHSNPDLGYARAPNPARNKRSAPGEGARSMAKKAKLEEQMLLSASGLAASSSGEDMQDRGDVMDLLIDEMDV